MHEIEVAPDFDKSIEVKEFKKMCKPLVYAWMREGRFLYIGATTKGFTRLMTHDIVGKIAPLRDTDYFCFWYPPPNMVFVLERLLIKQEQPLFQRRKEKQNDYIRRQKSKRWLETHRDGPEKQYCQVCGSLLKPTAKRLCFKCKLPFFKCDVKLAMQPKKVKVSPLVSLPKQ